MDQLLSWTIECIQEVRDQQGKRPVDLKPSTKILKEGILDSLELLEVIVLMEKKSGKRPFASGFLPFETVQDLATIYSC